MTQTAALAQSCTLSKDVELLKRSSFWSVFGGMMNMGMGWWLQCPTSRQVKTISAEHNRLHKALEDLMAQSSSWQARKRKQEKLLVKYAMKRNNAIAKAKTTARMTLDTNE